MIDNDVLNSIWHFNPRSREGSDALWQSRILHFYQISIHAPAKGATNNMEEKDNGKNYFNPRSREGSDQAYQSDFADLIISIHAPAKGATRLTRAILQT